MIVLTSLPPAGCSMLLRLQLGKLGCRLYKAVLVVQTVLRSRMNEVAVDQEFEQQAAENQLSRPVPVHGCTGTLEYVCYSLWRTKPVKTTKQRCDVIIPINNIMMTADISNTSHCTERRWHLSHYQCKTASK